MQLKGLNMDNHDLMEQFKKEKSLNNLNAEYIKRLESFVLDKNANFTNIAISDRINKCICAQTDSNIKDINLNDFFNFEKYLNKRNDLYFGSSRINLKENYELLLKKDNSITIKFKGLNFTFMEYWGFSDMQAILDNHISEFLESNGDKFIFKNNFCVDDVQVKSFFLFENNDFSMYFWFLKNNKVYCYKINLNLMDLDLIITNKILNNEFPKSINFNENNNEITIFLSEYGDGVSQEDYLNSIIDHYSQFNSNKYYFHQQSDNLIEKTILIENNILFINYWFEKNNSVYRYHSEINLCDFENIISCMINSTYPGILDLNDYFTSIFLNNLDNSTFNSENVFNILDAFNKKTSILIYIPDTSNNILECIDSVLKYTLIDYELFLIFDENLSDENLKLLEKYDVYDFINIIGSKGDIGIIKQFNSCINSSENDIIILNSDITVTSKWDQKLLISAYCGDNVGTVSPINNNDLYCDVRNINSQINADEIIKFIENLSFNGNVESPIGRKSCFFIKRELWEDIGNFKGFDWDIDFFNNARKKGWLNIINDSIFVYNKNNELFNLKTSNLIKKYYDSDLLIKHPYLLEDWEIFIQSTKVKNFHSFIKFMVNHYIQDFIKKNILYVTELYNNVPLVDNLNELLEKFNTFFVTLEEKKVTLWCYLNDNFIPVKEIFFIHKIPNLGELNLFYMNLFCSFKIDTIFIRFSLRFYFLYCQDITPIMFASKIKVPIIYGRSTDYLFEQYYSTYIPHKKKISFKNEKGVVYTAIFGDYESLLDPKVVNPYLDYICFTDNPNLKSDIWQIRLIDNLDMDNTRKARTIKTLPHRFLKDYDFSIWVDAGFLIIGDLEEYVNRYSKKGLFLGINHSWRDCLYDEAEAVIDLKKDDEKIVREQIKKYQLEGFPKQYGLVESGVIFRRHNNSILTKIVEEWNQEIMNFSKRDQLSLNYIFWKNNFDYDHVPIFSWHNQFFEHFHHTKDARDNKVTFSYFRVLLIADDNLKNLKISLNSINGINNNIPVSIISSEDYSAFGDYNINIHKFKNNSGLVDCLNKIINNIHEDFILLMNSGDILHYPLVKRIFDSINQNQNVGGIIFDEINYVGEKIFLSFKPSFSRDLYSKKDFINNKAVLNRNILISQGGFLKNKSFVNNFFLEICSDFEIIKLYDFGLINH